MKIIFLDIDGVLNGYNYWNTLGWKIISFLKNKRLKAIYKRITDPCGVHEHKVKLLSKIVHKTDAKVVLSSSWRFRIWQNSYKKLRGDEKKLIGLFNKYQIDIIDITPRLLRGSKRDTEILAWLASHEDEVENYIILDDENTDLLVFRDDGRFIQTSNVPKGVMIMGHPYENTGLRKKHVKKAIRILTKK